VVVDHHDPDALGTVGVHRLSNRQTTNQAVRRGAARTTAAPSDHARGALEVPAMAEPDPKHSYEFSMLGRYRARLKGNESHVSGTRS